MMKWPLGPIRERTASSSHKIWDPRYCWQYCTGTVFVGYDVPYATADVHALCGYRMPGIPGIQYAHVVLQYTGSTTYVACATYYYYARRVVTSLLDNYLSERYTSTT